ncbi:hypothetical protein DFH08DRAFT_1055109 [Mycena albidolilacea]|uniref:Uncharacterized protein n=1 Tax=Mycena albidolilacea TaxID=1033008 RepID=A0AAD6Z3C0_9AGAR|nr:hypothetical protein DFH08DRAFT_1055109 [Mycena albidolilacea]
MCRTRTSRAAQWPCMRRQVFAALRLGSTAPTSAPAPRANGPGLPRTHTVFSGACSAAPVAAGSTAPIPRSNRKRPGAPVHTHGPRRLDRERRRVCADELEARRCAQGAARWPRGATCPCVRGVHAWRGEGVTLPRARTPSVARCPHARQRALAVSRPSERGPLPPSPLQAQTPRGSRARTLSVASIASAAGSALTSPRCATGRKDAREERRGVGGRNGCRGQRVLKRERMHTWRGKGVDVRRRETGEPGAGAEAWARARGVGEPGAGALQDEAGEGQGGAEQAHELWDGQLRRAGVKWECARGVGRVGVALHEAQALQVRCTVRAQIALERADGATTSVKSTAGANRKPRDYCPCTFVYQNIHALPILLKYCRYRHCIVIADISRVDGLV